MKTVLMILETILDWGSFKQDGLLSFLGVPRDVGPQLEVESKTGIELDLIF